MYEKTNDHDQAANAYNQYILDTEEQGITERDQQSKAYKYLALYYVKQNHLEFAYHYAQKCTEFADTREEGKALLKDIAARRGGNVVASSNNILGNILKEHQDSATVGYTSADGNKDGMVAASKVPVQAPHLSNFDSFAQTPAAFQISNQTPLSFLSHQPQQSTSFNPGEGIVTPVIRQNPGIERVRQNELYISGNSPRFSGRVDDSTEGRDGDSEDPPRRELEPMNLTFTP